MFVLSREEMYFYDKHTIEKVDIPGKKLMENAGRGCAEFILNEILQPAGLKKNTDQKIIIFCGSGNNGGDGFVIARYLTENEYPVIIALTGSEAKMSPETKENFTRCLELGIPVKKLTNQADWEAAKIDLNEYAIIVDAVFGVGFQGEVGGWYKELFTLINQSASLRIAIDISSGIEADTGKADDAIMADYTLTMANFKFGHLLGEGRKRSGEVLVIDIGIPEEIYVKFPPAGKLITADNVIFPERDRFSHKGTYGKIGIIAGSPGFSGAAIMASRAALRSGAGLIKLFHPQGMETIFETSLIEVMTHPIPEDINGIDLESFYLLLEGLDALLIGPGIGVSAGTEKLVEFLLLKWHKPLVIDADAINVIASNHKFKQMLKGRLLTPHTGEFSRLSGKSVNELQVDPVRFVKEFAAEHECSILLKSATTLFSDGREIMFNISGNDGLSTGGSGDVLAGIIISFLGQKLDVKDAAISASYLLGATAENLAEIRKPASIIPTEIIEELFKY